MAETLEGTMEDQTCEAPENIVADAQTLAMETEIGLETVAESPRQARLVSSLSVVLGLGA